MTPLIIIILVLTFLLVACSIREHNLGATVQDLQEANRKLGSDIDEHKLKYDALLSQYKEQLLHNSNLDERLKDERKALQDLQQKYNKTYKELGETQLKYAAAIPFEKEYNELLEVSEKIYSRYNALQGKMKEQRDKRNARRREKRAKAVTKENE